MRRDALLQHRVCVKLLCVSYCQMREAFLRHRACVQLILPQVVKAAWLAVKLFDTTKLSAPPCVRTAYPFTSCEGCGAQLFSSVELLLSLVVKAALLIVKIFDTCITVCAHSSCFCQL